MVINIKLTESEEEEDDDQPVEILTPTEILSQFQQVNICAPMVRYSKLPFRVLVSGYETHITYTPMILAQEFSLSSKARDSDFTTSKTERGIFLMEESPQRSQKTRMRKVRGQLIAQFGGHDPVYMAHSAELIKDYVDGIDINCGCPQQWAYQEGIGSALLRKPDLVRDLVRSIKSKCGENFPVSIKIRVDSDLKNTCQLIQTAIVAGVSFITVHGRTRHQASSHPVNLESIKFAVEEARARIPIVANGDIFNLEDAMKTRKICGLSGVMSARGLLENPGLFMGYDRTPLSGIQKFQRICISSGFLFPLYHHHLSEMLGSWFKSKEDKKMFNMLSSYPAVIDYLNETYDIQP